MFIEPLSPLVKYLFAFGIISLLLVWFGIASWLIQSWVHDGKNWWKGTIGAAMLIAILAAIPVFG